MVTVAAALAPGLLIYVWQFGAGILVQCALAAGAALAFEAVLLRWRGRPIAPHLADGSAVVTGLLFALCITPLAPWWITIAGMLFAMSFGKHVYGGLGHNLFNPAMAGYVFVLLCFPAILNVWPTGAAGAPSFAAYLDAIFAGAPAAVSTTPDAISGATALTHMKSQLGAMEMVSEIAADARYGQLAGRGWEWVNAGFLAGGIALLFLKIIRWQIPAGMLGALLVLGIAFHGWDAEVHPSAVFHLFGGATMLGAFFIATDPVTAASTPRGRLLYGVLIGVLVYAVRAAGSYPDGVAFAVLIGNAAAPLIDHYTRPRVLGEE
jgi:electron transport complex protein RnfD